MQQKSLQNLSTHKLQCWSPRGHVRGLSRHLQDSMACPWPWPWGSSPWHGLWPRGQCHECSRPADTRLLDTPAPLEAVNDFITGPSHLSDCHYNRQIQEIHIGICCVGSTIASCDNHVAGAQPPDTMCWCTATAAHLWWHATGLHAVFQQWHDACRGHVSSWK